MNGLSITLVGDLKNGRTVHSLARMLSLYNVKLNYVSPKSLRIPDKVRSIVNRRNIQQREYGSLEEALPHTDVLYMTRIQKERFSSMEEFDHVRDSYMLDNDMMRLAKGHMIVMHPLPRVNEIDPEVDFDSRAAYFRQMKYGLYVRMALLYLILGPNADVSEEVSR